MQSLIEKDPDTREPIFQRWACHFGGEREMHSIIAKKKKSSIFYFDQHVYDAFRQRREFSPL